MNDITEICKGCFTYENYGRSCKFARIIYNEDVSICLIKMMCKVSCEYKYALKIKKEGCIL